jgi:methylenetetrahydrofolate dehydrogenase (NADP+)/methenyltetrahydrofolate cyclohydrolase
MITPQILTAQPVVQSIKENLILRCNNLRKRGITPKMSVVLTGDNPASLSYIKNKKLMCEQIGGIFELSQLPENISKNDFLLKLKELNNDTSIHGIIIQLPISPSLKDLNVFELVQPKKDIDGFHPENTKHLYQGSQDHSLLPCTPKGIVSLLNFYQIPISGQNILVIGRSLIVGKPLSMLLSNLNATVTLAHSGTKNLEHHTKSADIVISAVGKPSFLTSNYFSKKSIVIDVGINSQNSKLVGDVDFINVSKLVKAITPVPGGVGPMTVISLIENLITATELQNKEKL